MLERAKRASHIDPPKLPGAIMRRAFQRPNAERTVGSAGKFTESLTPDPELENSLGRLRTFDLLADMSLVESAAEVAA